MAERSDAASWEYAAARNLTAQREEFLETFFKRGAEFTSELLREFHTVQHRLKSLEDENAALKLQLASDDAIRDLLVKIDALEKEKRALAHNIESVRAESSDFAERFQEMEMELDSMANLYVASYQLHVALTPAEVFSIMEQILMQFVGVGRFAVYLRREAPGAAPSLEPVHLFHCDELSGKPLALDDGIVGEAVTTAVQYIRDPGEPREVGAPLACVPLVFGQTVIGVIVVHDLLEQKSAFVKTDLELFRLLGSHAAAAIAGAGMLARLGDVFAGLSEYRRV
jgi:hypothetical protein